MEEMSLHSSLALARVRLNSGAHRGVTGVATSLVLKASTSAALSQTLFSPVEMSILHFLSSVYTNLRPDMVLWSVSQRLVYFTELTVPFEESVEEASKRKELRYAD